MMYLITLPFSGFIVACVESKDDPCIPELLERTEAPNGWKVVDKQELAKLFTTYEHSQFTQPIACTAERFDEMLNILPPCQWDRVRGVEMFHMSERLYGNVVTWFFNYYGDYYTCDQLATTPRDELAEMVINAHNRSQ